MKLLGNLCNYKFLLQRFIHLVRTNLKLKYYINNCFIINIFIYIYQIIFDTITVLRLFWSFFSTLNAKRIRPDTKMLS